ncbi:hypothetical protein [Bacillus sp. FJAT-27245]|uniref:hypothetical protein n=1 Tax=Bacillus sp. FJAT-27245 TaxID=1684144 RepID=UPI0006A7A574|nr:hypothetical protein [Bacillus sp. FJAT-27245]
MKKLFSILISMGLLIALATSAFATNQAVGNSEVGNSKLLEKIGFTKEELIDLKANPDKVDINFEKPEKGIKKKIKKKDVLRLAQLGFTK